MQENNLCFLYGTATYGTVQLEKGIIDEISKLTTSFIFSSSGLSLQNKKKDENILSHSIKDKHEENGPEQKTPGFKQTNLELAVH